MTDETRQPFDLLLTNCRVATMVSGASEYGILEAAPAAAIGIIGDRIVFVGPSDMVTVPAAEKHDLGGRWVTPGLIDCHTHLVYGGNRSQEWELKLKGATYEEVAKAGGGIVNTVDGTRGATVQELVVSARPRIEAMLREGVTTVEIKSGYGLEANAERNMLLAAKQLGKIYNVDVRTTFLGAHACPREFKGREDEYIDTVVDMMEPLQKDGLVDAVDAFCEKEGIGFSVKQTSRVFDRATELCIPCRLHGDQLHGAMEGGALAAKYGALSCDHCEYTNANSIAAMAKAGTVALLLPTANYFIKEKQKPPVEGFRTAGVPMAIATNCNPGSSPCSSLLLVMNMACTIFGFTPEEALVGVTRNAAQVLGQSSDRGTIEVGKLADLAVWDVTSPRELAYYLGLNRLAAVYYHGRKRNNPPVSWL